MTVKISDFRENWVGIKVTGMKQPLLPFLSQARPTFWTTGPNKELFKLHFG